MFENIAVGAGNEPAAVHSDGDCPHDRRDFGVRCVASDRAGRHQRAAKRINTVNPRRFARSCFGVALQRPGRFCVSPRFSIQEFAVPAVSGRAVILALARLALSLKLGRNVRTTEEPLALGKPQES